MDKDIINSPDSSDENEKNTAATNGSDANEVSAADAAKTGDVSASNAVPADAGASETSGVSASGVSAVDSSVISGANAVGGGTAPSNVGGGSNNVSGGGGSNKRAPIALMVIAAICILGFGVFAWQYWGNVPLTGEKAGEKHSGFWSALFDEATSYEGSFEFSSKFNKTPSEELVPLRQVEIINASKITGDLKVSASEDGKKGKLEMNVNVAYSGMIIPASIWCDVDFSDVQNPKLLYILKCDALSGLSMGLIPADTYIYIDYTELPEMDQFMSSIESVVEDPEKIRDTIMAAFDKEKFKITESNGKYTATLDENSLKELCRDVLIASINVSYDVAVTAAPSEDEKTSLTMTRDEAVNSINEAFNEVKDMTLFAKDALVIDITLAEDKSVKTKDFTLNIKPDFKSIAKSQKIPEEEFAGYSLDFSVFFKTTFNNVNGPVNVVIPVLNETNSINLMTKMNSIYQGSMLIEESGEFGGEINDELMLID